MKLFLLLTTCGLCYCMKAVIVRILTLSNKTASFVKQGPDGLNVVSDSVDGRQVVPESREFRRFKSVT